MFLREKLPDFQHVYIPSSVDDRWVTKMVANRREEISREQEINDDGRKARREGREQLYNALGERDSSLGYRLIEKGAWKGTTLRKK